MSMRTINPLRQSMIDDMTARQLGPRTQQASIRSCKRFAAFLKRSPDTATADDIRRFQLDLAESDLSICNRNGIVTGVKFLFRVTLRRLALVAEFFRVRQQLTIPPVAMTSVMPVATMTMVATCVRLTFSVCQDRKFGVIAMLTAISSSSASVVP